MRPTSSAPPAPATRVPGHSFPPLPSCVCWLTLWSSLSHGFCLQPEGSLLCRHLVYLPHDQYNTSRCRTSNPHLSSKTLTMPRVSTELILSSTALVSSPFPRHTKAAAARPRPVHFLFLLPGLMLSGIFSINPLHHKGYCSEVLSSEIRG